MLGDCYLAIGLPREAVTVYHRALELDPESASVPFGLSDAYYQLGEMGKYSEWHIKSRSGRTRSPIRSPASGSTLKLFSG